VAVLVTGGARSGKSRFAEAYAARLASWGIYVATAMPSDDAEMEARIRAHREERRRSGFAWETVEEPFDLAGWLDRLAADRPDGAPGHRAERPDAAGTRAACASREHREPAAPVRSGPPVVLVDCLTLWLTNRLLAVNPDGGADAGQVERELDARIEELADAARRFPYPLVLVTNEVGFGIVPDTPLGRQFRDAAGRMNRRLASVCDRVFLVVSGIPVDLKAVAFRPDDEPV
jgi:adenosylcobinamide kinase/adenosylcobinamide-phosphate guanylyltransferase